MTSSAPYRYRYHTAFDNEELRARYVFPIWVEERCTHRDGRDDSGSVVTLMRDFHQWCEKAGVPPISNDWFDKMLAIEGYKIEHEMVSGLFLAEDAWVLEPRR